MCDDSLKSWAQHRLSTQYPAPFTLSFFAYRRPFKSPLKTSHGLWSERSGLIVRIAQGDRQGWGEVAPVPWFGTESFDQAVEYLWALAGAIAAEKLWSIDDSYPCCQFAIGSALEMLTDDAVQSWAQTFDHSKTCDNSNLLYRFPGASLNPTQVAGLMPAGAAALEKWRDLYNQGHRTLKWKVTGNCRELEIFEPLLARLPDDVTLRLDANGGLGRSLAETWLTRCDLLPPGRVEYFEQPLPPEDFVGLCRLQDQFETAIALDESVATVGQLREVAAAGWSGVVVVKPAIAGYPQRFFTGDLSAADLNYLLKQPWLEKFSGVVFSSVFETPIGQWGALKLAADLGGQSRRAMGFGTDAWLAPLAGVKLEAVVR
ncbi:MAG: o-succinylbenzoate synthase [Cyanophyceae cyanobacterium]